MKDVSVQTDDILINGIPLNEFIKNNSNIVENNNSVWDFLNDNDSDNDSDTAHEEQVTIPIIPIYVLHCPKRIYKICESLFCTALNRT